MLHPSIAVWIPMQDNMLYDERARPNSGTSTNDGQNTAKGVSRSKAALDALERPRRRFEIRWEEGCGPSHT
jgi:hypothetical protein